MEALRFTVKWLPPKFGNGQLQNFEMLVLSEENDDGVALIQLLLDVRILKKIVCAFFNLYITLITLCICYFNIAASILLAY